MRSRFAGQVGRWLAGLVGAGLILTYLSVRPTDWLIFAGGLFLLFYALAADTLVELSVGPKGILAKFQQRVIDRIQSTAAFEQEAASWSAEAVITEPKSPDEFADLLIDHFAQAGVATGHGQAHDATVDTRSSERDAAKG